MAVILKAENVSFLDRILYTNIEITENKTTFICGASGCGKSTLFGLFNATRSPLGGRIYYRDRNIDDWDTLELRKQVLLVGQSVFLFEGTIADNFREFHSARLSEAPPEEEMRRFLALCGTEFSTDARTGVMSGGERQRVFLAVCLSFMPKVLMLDEPTAALDRAAADGMLRRVKAFCGESGITLLVISHNEELARTHADEMIQLEGVCRYAGDR